MRISEKAIELLSNPKSRMNLGHSLGKTEGHIQKSLKANEDNGWLTKLETIEAIMTETGLAQDQVVDREIRLTETETKS